MRNGNIFWCFSHTFTFCLLRAEEFQVESKGLAAVATEMSETITDPKIQATQVGT